MLKLFFANYLDKFGLITKAKDGGDTCSRHCTALYLCPHTRADALHALKYLQVRGIPRRHPDFTAWYFRTNTTSRDQLIPYLLFVASPNFSAYYEVRNAFYALLTQHSKRLLLFAWNTRRNFQYPTLAEHQIKSTPDVAWNYAWKLPDICGPNIWATYIRGLLNYSQNIFVAFPLLYIALTVLDIYQLLAVLLIRTQTLLGYKIGPTHAKKFINHDMQNLTIMCHFSATNWATPTSWLSWILIRNTAKKAAHSFYTQADEPPLHTLIDLL